MTAADIDNTINVEFAITGGAVHFPDVIFYKYRPRANIQHQEMEPDQMKVCVDKSSWPFVVSVGVSAEVLGKLFEYL